MSEDVFRFSDPTIGRKPKPLEVATRTYERWLEEQRFNSELVALFDVWTNWKSKEIHLIQWYKELDYKDRNRLTPSFTDQAVHQHESRIWFGWVYNDFYFRYTEIPRDHKDYSELYNPVDASYDVDTGVYDNEEYRFLGREDPRLHRLSRLAYRAAHEYYRVSIRQTRNLDDRQFGINWLRSLVQKPSDVIAWFSSISETERKLSNPRILFRKSESDVKVLCYGDGRALIKSFPADAPEVADLDFTNPKYWEWLEVFRDIDDDYEE